MIPAVMSSDQREECQLDLCYRSGLTVTSRFGAAFKVWSSINCGLERVDVTMGTAFRCTFPINPSSKTRDQTLNAGALNFEKHSFPVRTAACPIPTSLQACQA